MSFPPFEPINCHVGITMIIIGLVITAFGVKRFLENQPWSTKPFIRYLVIGQLILYAGIICSIGWKWALFMLLRR